MGRPAKGPAVLWKRGWAYVRFTWQGARYTEALGTQDPEKASTQAARTYAEVVAGRRRPVAVRPGKLQPLEDLWADWVDWKRPSIDEETATTLEYYGDRFVDYFETLDGVTEARGASYGMARLGQVCRSTVLKELCFLRQFLSWCVQQGALLGAPTIPRLPPKAKGKRTGPQRSGYVEVTPEEAVAVIAALPELSKTIDGRKWPLRDRYAFAWETTFRPETVSRLSVPNNWRPGLKHVVLDDEDDQARYGREVDLTPAAVAILKRHAPEEGPIFGRHEYYKAIKRAAAQVLDAHRAKSFAPYDFRHGRARALIDAGAPIRGVSWLLGHKRVSTTDRYTAPDRRAGRAALAVAG